MSSAGPAAAPAARSGLLSPACSFPGKDWRRIALLALATLAVLWGWRLYATWATWGNLTVDCGREMYVPAVLAEGKTLYRDVYYPYLPAAPYLNSVLFRAFGTNLNVLYWAGSLAALGCAFLLFLTGTALGSPLAGWTAGAVVILESFQSWIFCFPLAYSYASVYGCLSACLFLWLVVRAAQSSGRAWLAGAGAAACAALLCKVEFGGACWMALVLLLAARALHQRSPRRFAGDAAVVLPGLLLCGVVAWWMVSLGGVDFILQENLMATWPFSHFMKVYAPTWVRIAGLNISGAALRAAALQLSILAAVLAAGYLLLRWLLAESPWGAAAAGVVIAVLGFTTASLPWQAEAAFRWIFFPQQMVLIVAAAAVFAAWKLLGEPGDLAVLALLVLFAFSSVLGFRILLGMVPGGYAIYYNGPAILSYLILAEVVLARLSGSSRFSLQAGALLCLGCLAAAWGVASRTTIPAERSVSLVTDRGTIRVSPHWQENYQAAIGFMKEKAARGEAVLALPEDTSLYFLSATHCPVRVLMFAPGIVVPGKMEREAIREIEQHNTRYLLWSNQTFEVYGAGRFGRDFDPELGRYLTSHYHPAGPIVPDDSGGQDWTATVWERNADGASAGAGGMAGR